MKNSIAIYSSIAIFLFYCKNINAQSLEIWSNINYSGTLLYTINLGQSVTFVNTGNSLSFNLSGGAAFKVKYNGTLYNNYPEISFYSEMDIPWMDGTGTQFMGNTTNPAPLVISCISKSLPQPPVFIPINSSNIHPAAGSHVSPGNGNKMLMLRQANFWENSEDIAGVHAPYAKIYAYVCKSYVANIPYQQIISNEYLWKHSPHKLKYSTLYGNSYEDFGNAPDAFSEWIDNWWGTYYSNIGLWNWTDNPSENSITLLVTEGDSGWPNDPPDDILGRALITEDMEGYILIKCRMYGWVIVEMVNSFSTSSEENVDNSESYVYLGDNIPYPENAIGPQNNLLGTQYNPFRTISQVQNIVPLGVQNGDYKGNTVGVMGDGVIKGNLTLNVPMTYKAAAPPDKPIAYTFTWNNYSAKLADETENIISSLEKVELLIYPNPASDNIIFSYELKENEIVSLSLFDMMGNKISNLIDGRNQVMGKYEVKWNINNLAQGVYLAVFKSGNNTYNQRWIKK